MRIENSVGISHPPITLARHYNYVVSGSQSPSARAVPLPQQNPSNKLKLTGRRGDRRTRR